jgi:hypothetical protein
VKQPLGPKKHARCEQITGKVFAVCYTRGSWPHGWAECWPVGGPSEQVNYRPEKVSYKLPKIITPGGP